MYGVVSEAEHKAAAKKQHLVSAKKAEEAKKAEVKEKEPMAAAKKVVDDETEEDEHDYLDTKRQHHAPAHSKTNLLSVDQVNYLQQKYIATVFMAQDCISSPSNAEATLVQCTKTQKFLKSI